MAKRQNNLAALMKKDGINLHYPMIIEKRVFSESKFHNEINLVYKRLGGVLENYPIGFGDFDIITKDYFVELDEEKSFYNSYTSSDDRVLKN